MNIHGNPLAEHFNIHKQIFEMIPSLVTMDGKDRDGEDRDTDEFEDFGNEAGQDDEDDYGDE